MKKLMVTCVVVVLFAFCTSVQADTLYVGLGQTYATIQDAANAAENGDVINVQTGTYTEQVEISGISDLSIEGDMATITVPIDGMTGSLVKIVDCQDFQFTGFTIDGNNGIGVEYGAKNGGGVDDTRFYGLFVINSSGLVANNIVKDISWGNSVDNGIGIYAYVTDGTARDIEVSGNTIKNFQRGGLSVRGPIKSKISKNIITHWGLTSIIAGNGIQVDGGTSLIIGNTVSDSRYYEEPDYTSWCSSAILLIGYLESADNYRVVRNYISNSDYGIAVLDYGLGITDVTIVNNTFNDNLWDTYYYQDGKIDIKEHASKYE